MNVFDCKFSPLSYYALVIVTCTFKHLIFLTGQSSNWLVVSCWCLWASSHSSCQHSDASHPTCNGIGEIYQIVGNTKDINTHISAIYHGCRCISVATVIYFSAGAHLSCDGEISSTQSGWRTECSHTHINTQHDEMHPCATSRSPRGKR